MREFRECLRLQFGLGLDQSQVARSCSIAQATVHRYLKKAAAAGVSWPLPEDWDDDRLGNMISAWSGRNWRAAGIGAGRRRPALNPSFQRQADQ
jgi:hypothetical protein